MNRMPDYIPPPTPELIDDTDNNLQFAYLSLVLPSLAILSLLVWVAIKIHYRRKTGECFTSMDDPEVSSVNADAGLNLDDNDCPFVSDGDVPLPRYRSTRDLRHNPPIYIEFEHDLDWQHSRANAVPRPPPAPRQDIIPPPQPAQRETVWGGPIF